MNDDTRLDTSDIPCPVKGHGGYYGSNCEMCEIESLQASLLTAQGQLKELKDGITKTKYDCRKVNWKDAGHLCEATKVIEKIVQRFDNLLKQLDTTKGAS